MRQVRAQFSSQEVAAYAVSSLDSDLSITNWIADTGLRVPVITDNSSDLSCWEMPEGVMSLYHHFFERRGDEAIQGLAFFFGEDHYVPMGITDIGVGNRDGECGVQL